MVTQTPARYPDRYIGAYRVLRRLGSGGMGTVYEAIQEDIGRRVAIKLLHAEHHEDPTAIARLFNEARAVNLIRHAGIVSIFEYGRDPDGAAFLVMEYLEGEVLSQRLHRCGRLGPAGVRICRQIASAVAAAHQRDVIHRDLKPGNIMIVAEPEIPGGERAKILDFGIAKRTATSREEAEMLDLHTRTGLTLGTPTYMSPEQCRGAADLDGKTDVYSLGVVLYQVLVGHPPFQSDVPGEVMGQHLMQRPRPPRELDPLLPQELSALVEQMLAKDPASRPTMDQVAAHLQRIEAARWAAPTAPAAPRGAERQAPSHPTLSTISRAAGQASPGERRRPWAVALGAGCTLLLLGGVGLWREREPGGAASVHAVAAPPGQAQVRWRVTSEPPGAALIRDADGVVLGRTPWEQVQGAGLGVIGVTLRRDGYRDQYISLDRGRDQVLRERLIPQSAAAAQGDGARVSRPRPASAPPRKKVKRNEEIDFFR